MPLLSNILAERQSFVTHLECSMTGETYPADEVHGLSRVGRPLLVRYDLPAIAAHLDALGLPHSSDRLGNLTCTLPGDPTLPPVMVAQRPLLKSIPALQAARLQPQRRHASTQV